MTRSRNQYTHEFKIEAIQLLDTSGESASQLKRELEMGKGNLCR